jgi:outer membrane lipase/esterase
VTIRITKVTVALLTGAVGGACALLLAGAAQAQTFSQTIFFGDSNTDSGRYLYLSGPQGLAPPGAGTYTTNPDPGWAASLSSRFGLSSVPQDAPGGGNNYAAGGARVSFTGANPNVWSATTQIDTYFALTGGTADPNALYTVWIGTNDLKTSTSGGPGNIVDPPNNAAIVTLGQQTAALVVSLAEAGARYILVPNTTSIKSAAASAASGESYNINLMNSRALYDQTVWNGIHAAGVNFIPADFDTVFNYVLLNPATFGITHTSVVGANAACGTVSSYQCTQADWVAPNADQTYFFADGTAASDGGGHLSGAVQKVEADYYYGLITAPSEISFLAEAPVKTRTSLVETIYQQMAISEHGRMPGTFNTWVGGDVSSLSMDNYNGFPSDPGTPGMLAVGFDYLWTPNLLLGGAVSVATTTQSFSIGGNFRQNEAAFSGYAAFAAGRWWLDLVGTVGALHYDVNRIVPLGIIDVSNTGSTIGSNASLAAELGYNFRQPFGSADRGLFKAPASDAFYLVHGPVAGILLQRVAVDGYTEIDSLGGVTALSYADQVRDSAVTELGYQAQIALGIWSPYAKLTWNHELVPYDRSVTASLTTITAPSYSMPAVALGKDWGTGTVGTTVALRRGVTAYASLTGQFGQSDATFYGGQVGLNVALNPPPPVVTQ